MTVPVGREREALEIGSTANSYQILAKLAAGGMAEIFLARGAGLAGVERYVVLKRILPERTGDESFIRMFLDEARLAAQLQHPNIAQVYDIGRLGGSYFFTMEYVHGETVRAMLGRGFPSGKKLPLGCVLAIAAQSAAGLHHAHDRIGIDGRALGIVHRDVSPSNLMVSFEGNVKVVDFGVAKAADRLQETRAGTLKGKISYLAPEQCRGMPVDRRTDLFALGIVMWEMLTGERLYRNESDFATMTEIVTEVPTLPSSVRADVPPVVDALVMRLLDKDPARRYQSGAELVEAIEEVALLAQVTLSVTALGKLMRELFGQRPEPWIELREIEVQPGITVTSQPIGVDLVAVPAEALRDQLASVIDLSSHRARVTDGLPFVPHVDVEAPTSIAPGAAAAVSPAPSPFAPPPVAAPSRRALWPIFVALAVAAGLGAGAVWLAMRNPNASDLVVVVAADASRADPAVAIDAAPVDAAPVAAAPVAIDASADVEAIELLDTEGPSLAERMKAADYEGAVRACSAGAMTVKLAPACTLAACKLGLATVARTWFTSVPASRRPGLVAVCKTGGVIVGEPAPATGPHPPLHRTVDAGVDCAADPLACQH